MSIIRKVIRKIFGKSQGKYPYTYSFHEPSITNRKVKFRINNTIEEFRLRHWGNEKEYVLSMVKALKPNDILLDIGSSVGLISVLSSFRLVNGSVVSIEPDPENYNCLLTNFKLNGQKNFKAHQLAAGDTKDKLELFTSGSNGYSPSLKKVNGIDQSILVDVVTIDSLVQENKIKSPTVVKIDIEGAELLALKGMKQLLSGTSKPRLIYLEVHPDFLGSFRTSKEELFDYLKNFSYKITEQIEREQQILCKLEISE